LIKKRILKSHIKGKKLHITTKNPEKDLLEVVSILKSKREKLHMIKVAGASLDDVFIKIWKDNE
jgi:hypothetical protein